ncbi:Sugar phosphate permease [Rhizobium tibeticum]|uniref:Putative sulfoacetate transporter SauU n=1 Tax=Rhizobium tibeticum TaxID=501024 RepID=A0A1H8LSC6_9HYPH|nr:MFS transporter [Rhizobium tibeticum]SEH89378.1 putative sulfoacetate transporter SauU [Rhizobium tibeticum]SEO08000.1 Sugar phosphate permease [Rhizobium tibeticum]
MLSSIKRRHIIIGMLFACWVVGFIDKTAINIAIIPISEEFGLSSDHQGMIISAFFLTYSMTQLIGGYLVDRFGSRRVLSSAVAIWSLGTMASGAVANAIGLAAARAATGAGEAVFPAGGSVAITEHFEKSQMARAKSVLQSGASVGFAVGSIVITALIAAHSWRMMFFVLGVVGLVLSAALYIIMKPISAPRVAMGAGQKISEKKRVGALLKNSLTWKITAVYFFTNIVFWGLQSWLPSYWVKVKGMSMVEMGAYSMIPPALGFVSFLTCGWLLDRFFHQKEKYLICIGSVVSAVFIYLMANAQSIPLAFAYLSISNVFLNAISISVFVSIMKHFPQNSVGTATGLINSLAQLGSFISPMLIGAVLSATGQNYGIAFSVLVGCAVIVCAIATTFPAIHGKKPVEQTA